MRKKNREVSRQEVRVSQSWERRRGTGRCWAGMVGRMKKFPIIMTKINSII